MKKQIKFAIMIATIITLIGGCGKQDEQAAVTAVDTGVGEVIAEAVQEPENDEPVSDESDTVTETAVVETGDIDIEAFEADEAKDHKLGDISYVAQYRDMRETTNQHSESTEDVWEYLTEDGFIDTNVVDELWEYGVNSYTGRWAYPEITQCDATAELYLYDWTDSYCSYITDDGEDNTAVLFCTGYDVFESYTNENEAGLTFEEFGTLEINDEHIDVFKINEGEGFITYIYKFGGFTVVIEFQSEDDETSDTNLVEVMNHIIF